MRIIGLMARGGLMSIFLMLISGYATQPITQPLFASIEHIHGNALYSMDGNNWLPLTNDMPVALGMTVATPAKGYADLLIGDMSETSLEHLSNDRFRFQNHPFKLIRIFENSSVTLERATKEGRYTWTDWEGKNFDEKITLRLNHGSILGDAVSALKSCKLDVKLANDTVSVSKKSIFSVDSSGTVRVLSGRASIFFYDKGESRIVLTNQKFDFVSGSLNEIPKNEGYAWKNSIMMLDDRELGDYNTRSARGSGMGGSWRKF